MKKRGRGYALSVFYRAVSNKYSFSAAVVVVRGASVVRRTEVLWWFRGGSIGPEVQWFPPFLLSWYKDTAFPLRSMNKLPTLFRSIAIFSVTVLQSAEI